MGVVSSAESHRQAMLDAWRERGADRLDPIRFRFIEALHRRAASQTGEAGRILDERLTDLLARYADDLDRAASRSGAATCGAPPCEPACSALAELLDHVSNHAARRPRAYPAPEMLDDFREIWSSVRTEKQLRQSLDQVPTNAGPLNSSHLVHRSLSLMRELSPAYLRQFLSYVDALSWLEQMGGDDTSVHHDAPRSGSARKSTRVRQR